jgi:hypothetical protein
MSARSAEQESELTDRLAELERRVRAVEDFQAIQKLLVLSCHRVDANRLDRMAGDIFTEDAVVDYGMVRVSGRDQIHAFYTGFDSNLLGTSHNLTNAYIDVDGDEARSLSYVLAWHWHNQVGGAVEPLPTDILVVGGYQDRLRRTPDGWRIVERITVQFGTGVGAGAPTPAIRPVIEGMLGRLPTWPD